MSLLGFDFKIISLEASGFDGLERILGSLWYLQTTKKLDNISVYAASSATSYIAIMTIMGYSVIDIIQDLLQIKVISQLCPFRDGIHSKLKIDNLREHLKNRIQEKYGKQLTFLELLKETGKRFVTIAMDERTKQLFYFYDETCPHMDIVDAVCAACSTSGVFDSFSYGDKSYVDAGSIKPLILDPFIGQDIEIVCICVDQYIPFNPKSNIIEAGSYGLKNYFINLHQLHRNEILNIASISQTTIKSIIIPPIMTDIGDLELKTSMLIALGWKSAESIFSIDFNINSENSRPENQD